MFCARPSTSNRSSSLDAGRSRFRGDFRIRVGVPQITPLSTSENKAVAEGEGFEPPVPLRAQRFSRPPVSTAHASLRSRVLSAVYQPWITSPAGTGVDLGGTTSQRTWHWIGDDRNYPPPSVPACTREMNWSEWQR